MKRILLFTTLYLFTFQVCIAQTPSNNLIQNATLVEQSPHEERNVRIDNATASPGGQNGCSLAGFKVIYYKFTATSTNTVTITVEDSREGWTLGSAFAIVYSASNLNATSDSQLTNITACAFGGVTSFTPTIGTNYYILIHRSGGQSVWSTITVDMPQTVTASENAALQDLYNSTNGASWTNQTNWNTTNPESSWSGVTVKNGHVSKLTLNTNNLNGSIPTSILNLPYLEEINVNSNNLSGTLPNLSTISTITNVNITNNDYSFADLEANFSNNNTIATFNYQTQNKRDTEDIIDGIVGNSYNLTLTAINGTNVQYQWYKKRYNYFNASDELISGATSNIYAIPSLQDDDFDVYFCRATSTSIPDLIIDRNTIEIKGEVSQQQKDALIAIYNATNGASWNNNTNWLSTEPVSDWYGVTVTGNKISRLTFDGNNLTGTLPPEIGNLSELRVLSFEYNNFIGEIPASYANLTKLRGFWFNNNQLSGEVPNFVATNYPNLVFFDISFNDFQGLLPDFTSLQYINYININNNHFYASDFSAQHNDYLNLVDTWVYSPQTTLDIEETESLVEGGDITLMVSESTTRYGNYGRAQVFQWYKDNVLISGATTNPYTITNASMSDSGSYHCVITDPDVTGLEVIRAPIIVDVTFGVNENEINVVQIYPNPTNSLLNIKQNNSYKTNISLYNILGKKVMQSEFQGTSTIINIENLQSGVYMLKIDSENGSITKQIIKN